MSSTQKNLLGKADQTTMTTTTMTTTTTTTTTTLTVPGTNTTIQVTGTKVTIPASFGRRPHRQPAKTGNNNTTTTKTDSKSDDAPKSDDASSAAKPSTPSGTCPHYKWQPSPNPSPRQARRYVPDCAKPRKGLIPTPAPKWCHVCCSGPMPPWAEAPKESRKTGKEEEGKRGEDEEDQEYDWRHEDDFTDVWYDGMD